MKQFSAAFAPSNLQPVGGRASWNFRLPQVRAGGRGASRERGYHHTPRNLGALRVSAVQSDAGGILAVANAWPECQRRRLRPRYHKVLALLMPLPALAGIDESELVTLARTGDARSFSELVRRYEGKIFRLAQHITQNREDAEDVLQETFLKAYEHLDQFQGNSKFYTWIVRIAVNQALMKLRRRKTDRSVSLDETIDTGDDTLVREIAAWDENPEQQYSREELGGILEGAVASLEAPYRSVFVLRDIDELSTEETAEALGLSVPAVKSRLLRARLQLREKLTRYFRRKGNDVFAYL